MLPLCNKRKGQMQLPLIFQGLSVAPSYIQMEQRTIIIEVLFKDTACSVAIMSKDTLTS